MNVLPYTHQTLVWCHQTMCTGHSKTSQPGETKETVTSGSYWNNQSITESINQSINQPVSPAVSQSVSQPVSQSVSQSVRSINLPMTEWKMRMQPWRFWKNDLKKFRLWTGSNPRPLRYRCNVLPTEPYQSHMRAVVPGFSRPPDKLTKGDRFNQLVYCSPRFRPPFLNWIV